MRKKIYPASWIELIPLILRHSNGLMNTLPFVIMPVIIALNLKAWNINMLVILNANVSVFSKMQKSDHDNNHFNR